MHLPFQYSSDTHIRSLGFGDPHCPPCHSHLDSQGSPHPCQTQAMSIQEAVCSFNKQLLRNPWLGVGVGWHSAWGPGVVDDTYSVWQSLRPVSGHSECGHPHTHCCDPAPEMFRSDCGDQTCASACGDVTEEGPYLGIHRVSLVGGDSRREPRPCSLRS